MRGRIKFSDWVAKSNIISTFKGDPFALISMSKKKAERVFIDHSLAAILEKVEHIDFDSKDFLGATEVTGSGNTYFSCNLFSRGAYVCKEWTNKIGIRDNIYIKVKSKR